MRGSQQISDKVAIDFERVRLDGGPLRVYNPWYDKGTGGGGAGGLLEGASPVAPVPEEDEGCESEASLESTTRELRDRDLVSMATSNTNVTATASGKENLQLLHSNGQTVAVRRALPCSKVDRSTSTSVSAHPMAVTLDRTFHH
ncbi:hypothetical protein BIW11_02176 [Tropilaelaps mercedesae]|uniref:Uncharacterized protein n=1 Tax=Tropilaelaps mercedesae TaxID=418985 RepID=A0A1V9X2C5_9ACAR|nr:hypothetical protein BIW11_02176 [Tropilaelaps mercedesae]